MRRQQQHMALYSQVHAIRKSTFCPHSVFMCSVWIWEKTAVILLCSLNWLVFITETECVYCAVRAESMYNIDEPCIAQWLLYVPPRSALNNSTFWPQSAFICFVWISEQTAIISLYSINWLVFITDKECIYCAVRVYFNFLITRAIIRNLVWNLYHWILLQRRKF
jgi:hypothetical protein